MSAASVAVRGWGVAYARPDGVRLRLTVGAVRADADAALADATEAARALAAVLDAAGVPPANRISSGVRVGEEREWDRGRSVRRGFRAASHVTVTIDEPDAAGRVVSAAVSDAGADVEGPWWLVDSDNPGRLEACRRAAEDAAHRAGAYAGALGLRLGAVLEVREPGVGGDGGGPHRVELAMAASGSDVARGEPLDLDAGDLEVTATVDVTFALEHG